MRVNIYLDDIRDVKESYNYTNNPIYLRDNWTTVRNYKEFVALLEKIIVDNLELGILSLDHDLAPEHYEIPTKIFDDYTADELGIEMTGLDCAKYLTEWVDRNKRPIPMVNVHSMNPVGKERIQQHVMDWMDTHGGDDAEDLDRQERIVNAN